MPGADDPTIQADIVATLGRDAAFVADALDMLARIAGAPLAGLDPPQRETVAIELRAKGGAAVATLTRVVLQCYYRDDRVVRSLGLEPRPPYPERPCAGGWRLVAAGPGPGAPPVLAPRIARGRDADPVRRKDCRGKRRRARFWAVHSRDFRRAWGTCVRLSAIELAETAKAGVSTQVLDRADRAAAAAWIVEIEQTTGGAADVLVNNSGGVAGQEMQPIEEVPDADWDRIFAVNIGAAFALSRAAAAGMKRAGSGRIVNISSGAGLAASLTGIQAYCSAKHAVVGFTRQLAHELGPFGITVNSIAPGFIRSNPASEKQWAGYGEEGQRALVERIAMKRLGTAQDIANSVVFFASDLAGFVNGQVLAVDGGK